MTEDARPVKPEGAGNPGAPDQRSRRARATWGGGRRSRRARAPDRRGRRVRMTESARPARPKGAHDRDRQAGEAEERASPRPPGQRGRRARITETARPARPKSAHHRDRQASERGPPRTPGQRGQRARTAEDARSARPEGADRRGRRIGKAEGHGRPKAPDRQGRKSEAGAGSSRRGGAQGLARSGERHGAWPAKPATRGKGQRATSRRTGPGEVTDARLESGCARTGEVRRVPDRFGRESMIRRGAREAFGPRELHRGSRAHRACLWCADHGCARGQIRQSTAILLNQSASGSPASTNGRIRPPLNSPASRPERLLDRPDGVEDV